MPSGINDTQMTLECISTRWNEIKSKVKNQRLSGLFENLATDCGIVVSDMEFQTRYYVHFRTNTQGKGMCLLILLAMG